MNDALLARDSMVRRLVTVARSDSALPAIRLLLRRNVTGAPVVSADGTYEGVFSERSCLSAAMELLEGALADADDLPTAYQVMARRLVVLAPDDDVIQAIGTLLVHRVSGVPIVDPQMRFLGVFSEKTSMSAILHAVHDQMPPGPVRNFADVDPDRQIAPAFRLKHLVERFLETPYRRLVIMEGDRVIGMVSRRDVIRSVIAAADRRRTPGDELGTVGTWLDPHAKTVSGDVGLLDIAQVFRDTNFRRLPVVEDGTLDGQISRHDVLATFHRHLAPQREDRPSPLYLSSVRRREEAPIS